MYLKIIRSYQNKLFLMHLEVPSNSSLLFTPLSTLLILAELLKTSYNISEVPKSHKETPGIQMSVLYWPAKVHLFIILQV